MRRLIISLALGFYHSSFCRGCLDCASHVTHLLCLSLGLTKYLLSFTFDLAKSLLGLTLGLACFFRGLALHLLLQSLRLVLGFLSRASNCLLDLVFRLFCIMTSAYIMAPYK